ncbi:hypothetical protein AB205_0215280, partial [Aquarana catesbeiana]
MEIRKYQKSTDLLIRKAPFARLVSAVVGLFAVDRELEMRWVIHIQNILRTLSHEWIDWVHLLVLRVREVCMEYTRGVPF